MIFKFFTFSKKQQKTMWILLAIKMCMQVSFAVAMFGVFNIRSSAVGNNTSVKDVILKFRAELPVKSPRQMPQNPLLSRVLKTKFKEQKTYLMPYFFDGTEQYIVLNLDSSLISIDKATIDSNLKDPKEIWKESLQQILQNNTIFVEYTFIQGTGDQSDCYAIEIDQKNINKNLFKMQKIDDFIGTLNDAGNVHLAKFVKLECKKNARSYFIFCYKHMKGNVNFFVETPQENPIFKGNQKQIDGKINSTLKSNFNIESRQNVNLIKLIFKQPRSFYILLIMDITLAFDLNDSSKKYVFTSFSDIWQRYPTYREILSWVYEAIKNKSGIGLTDFEKTFFEQYESNEQYVFERVQKVQKIDKEKQERVALAEQARLEKEKANAQEIEKKRQIIPSQNRPIGQSEQEPAKQKSVQDEVTAIQKRRLPTLDVISESPVTTPRGTNVEQIREKVFSPRKPVGRSVSLGSQKNVQETEWSRIEITKPTQVNKKEERSESKSAITLSEEGLKKPLQEESVEESKKIEEVAKRKRQKKEKKWSISEKELKEGPEKLRVEKEQEQQDFSRKKQPKNPTAFLSFAKKSQSEAYERVKDVPQKEGGEKPEPDEEPEKLELEEQETEREDNPDSSVNTNVSKESSQSDSWSWGNWFIKLFNSFVDAIKSFLFD